SSPGTGLGQFGASGLPTASSEHEAGDEGVDFGIIATIVSIFALVLAVLSSLGPALGVDLGLAPFDAYGAAALGAVALTLGVFGMRGARSKLLPVLAIVVGFVSVTMGVYEAMYPGGLEEALIGTSSTDE